MSNKKLFTEVERTLKKCSEGILNYDDIHQRIEDASSHQRERLESDLKKEIKKLQKYRETIKQWINNDIIKDKSNLKSMRKQIEERMESFKKCEKETKTKEYSKEALRKSKSQHHKPSIKLTQDQIESKQWFSLQINTLITQNNELEIEIEKYQNTSRSNKKYRNKINSKQLNEINKINDRIDRNKWHLEQLQICLDKIINNHCNALLYKDIRDDVEYYINEAMDDEQYIQYDEMYLIITHYNDNNQSHSQSEGEQSQSEDHHEDDIIIDHDNDNAANNDNDNANNNNDDNDNNDNDNDNNDDNDDDEDEDDDVNDDDDDDDMQKDVENQNKRVELLKQQRSRPNKPPITISSNNIESESDLAPFCRRLSDSEHEILDIICCGYIKRPQPLDTHEPSFYKPFTPYPTPSYFPKERRKMFDNAHIFGLMELDTLFFIFYYQSQSYQQFMAAKELKIRGWSFNKRYSAWFQRHFNNNNNMQIESVDDDTFKDQDKSPIKQNITKNEIKSLKGKGQHIIVDNKYERGTYIFFDRNQSWQMRMRENFKFDYQYLEDEQSVNVDDKLDWNKLATYGNGCGLIYGEQKQLIRYHQLQQRRNNTKQHQNQQQLRTNRHHNNHHHHHNRNHPTRPPTQRFRPPIHHRQTPQYQARR